MSKIKRAAHFDFHTMPGVTGFGKDFDAEDFAQTLSDAKIQYINSFARCNIGHSYYKTKVGIPYKEMNGSQLEDIIKACHKRNIGVTAYINGGLNHALCLRQPNFMKINKQGVCMEDGDRVANNFFRTMCLNTLYRQYLYEEIKEIIALDADGIFVDCMVPRSCYCPSCIKKMKENGIDINDDKAVYTFAVETVVEVAHEIRALVPEDKRVYINSIQYELIAPIQSHLELECLPTGGWGYDFFGVQAPYQRNFGKDEKIYMTGRFVKSWDDIGGIKSRVSLENDVYDALLYGFGMSIGDYMNPHGTISKELYKTVGEIYSFMEQLEKWTDNTRPLCDVCVLRNKVISTGNIAGPQNSDIGVCRMLSELKICYEVMDEDMDFTKFSLLVLPDNIEITDKLEEKLNNFKGAIISSGKSFKKNNKIWDFVEFLGEDTHSVAWFEDEDEARNMYEPSQAIKSNYSVSDYFEPYFNRHWDGEQAYAYITPKGKNGQCAVAKKDNRAYICFNIFGAYINHGPHFHKTLVKNLIDELLPNKLIKADSLPQGARATLFEGEDNVILMIKTTYPELRGSIGVVEDHIELPEGRKIKVLGNFETAQTIPDLKPLDCKIDGDYTEITLPEIVGFKAIELR